MALFETMRENTKAILWITVIAFVGLIFLAWGADFSSHRRGGHVEEGVIGSVNGQQILARDFEAAFEEGRSSYEQQTGRQPDESYYLMLQASAWDQLIERALVRQEAQRRGIVVTEKEVATALLYNPLPRFRNSPGFLDDKGQFDLRLYQAWLADNRTNTIPLEREYRELVLQQKLRMLMLSGVVVSNTELRQAWVDQNEKLDLAYVQVPYARVRVDEQVDDATLERYLQEHREDFRLPEQIALEYVKLVKKASETDSLQAYSEIEEAYQEFRRGEDFGVLVKSYSQAPQERWGGENSPYLERRELASPVLANAAFSLPVGGVSEIITTPDGFHLIRVEDRKAEDGVEKVRMADIFIPVKITYDTNYALRERATDLVDSTSAVGFSESAQGFGLPVQRTGLFDPQAFIPGLGRVAAAKEFATRARPQDTSRPIETADAWYVLHVTERRPARDATLADVQSRVRSACLLERRKEAARALAESVLQRCQGGIALERAVTGDSTATYATSQGVTRLGTARGIGRDPQLTSVAFSATGLGLIPRVIMGGQAAYVVNVTARMPLDETTFAEKKTELRQRLFEQKQREVLDEWMRQMRESARIEDFRPVIASM